MRVDICGVGVDDYSFDEVVNRIVHHALTSTTPEYVVTPNAHHIMMLQHDRLFREIYHHSFLSVPDGVPLLWAAHFLGTPLNGRVNGTDLFEELCAVAAQKGLRVFLLGGRPGAADRAKAVLQARHPSLDIVGTHCPPYGFERDPDELALIQSKVRAGAPHLLFVGLGAPKQEKWMYAHYKALGVPISLGIGVSFELVADMVRRAPVPMQKLGMEWLFRLLMEPKRLWQRYILGNPYFVWLVLRQRLGISSFRLE
ncbi:WecB/TagA/CpsF family glycosyltransferase [Thermoleptolyngbya sp. C42_A2020_037]|uniref:WecB/TagA/CpsF family glycosyltransferase n=1 Tax=Thermoleptolyngbya sp. C42_A2020_037 TaxID=2747799 RepID=UPI001A0555F8|nr:WecB/TagA/CpsF family glycosyltransferase [Thermoleptolyngbya sp. C42_A2020_037]MBF2084104.1 WecB/TagA/CpsF family glycosyltransferase [Thermoleptolyngbya sp. C42_A2020_037]